MMNDWNFTQLRTNKRWHLEAVNKKMGMTLTKDINRKRTLIDRILRRTPEDRLRNERRKIIEFMLELERGI